MPKQLKSDKKFRKTVCDDTALICKPKKKKKNQKKNLSQLT